MRVKANDIPISELEEGDELVAEGLFSYDSQSLQYELDLIALRHRDAVSQFKTTTKRSSYRAFQSKISIMVRKISNYGTSYLRVET